MAYSLVYQYVWRDYGLSPSKGLLLTLSDNEAILLIAVVTTLIAFSQTRSWVITRLLLHRHAMPKLQLEDPDRPTTNISQLGALGYLVNPQKQARNQQVYTVPRVFGIAAIVNALVFLALGVFLPWSLVGGIETPLVKSRKTDTCVGLEMRGDIVVKTANLADSFFKQCWYNLSDAQGPCDRAEEISSYRLPLYISRTSECPFPGDVCQNKTQTVRLGHQYISPRLIGVNSKSRLGVGHQLICAPLKIEQFLLRSNASETRAILNFGNWTGLFDETDKLANYAMVLGTFNGPNHLSVEKSGRTAILGQGPYDLRVFPPEEERNATERIYSIHPDLRRADATVFVIVLQAGRTYYDMPLDDPFFSAHDLYKLDSYSEPYYLPDHEATALGCVEQYQLCFGKHEDLCLPWQAMDIESSDMIQLHIDLYEAGDIDSANDVFPVITKLIRTISAHRYLIARRGTKALLASLWRQNELATNIDDKEQWIHELKAWFETSIVSARFGFLELVKRTMAPTADEEKMSKEAPVFRGVCDRILFRSGDYTNFYFVRLTVAISTLLLLSLLSYEETYRAFRYAGNGFAMLFVGILSLGKTTVISSWQRYSHILDRLHRNLTLCDLHVCISSTKAQATQILNSWTDMMQNVKLPSWVGSAHSFRKRSRLTTADSGSGPASRSRGVQRLRPSHQPLRPTLAPTSGTDVGLNNLQ